MPLTRFNELLAELSGACALPPSPVAPQGPLWPAELFILGENLRAGAAGTGGVRKWGVRARGALGSPPGCRSSGCPPGVGACAGSSSPTRAAPCTQVQERCPKSRLCPGHIQPGAATRVDHGTASQRGRCIPCPLWATRVLSLRFHHRHCPHGTSPSPSPWVTGARMGLPSRLCNGAASLPLLFPQAAE